MKQQKEHSLGSSKEKGLVLVVSIMLLLMMSIVGILALRTSNTEMTISSNEYRASEAFYAAESGVALAEQALWDDYVSASLEAYGKDAGEKGNLDSYKYFLSTLGIENGFDSDLIVDQDLSETAFIKSVAVRRSDVSDGVLLEISSEGGSVENARAMIVKDIKVGAAPFEGFAFSILANNVNCIMCHARFDNVDRYYNTVDSLKGTYQRVKVASLESLLLRTNSADSRISGTLYTRGIVTDKSGNPISDLSNGGLGLTAHQFDTTNGNIIEPLNIVDLVNATGSPLPQYANLYLNYPTNEDEMTDGPLPGSFPPAIPDVNGNRFVDDTEFSSISNEANGVLSGGVKLGLSPGQSYTGGNLPASGNLNKVTQNFDGNLILVGTEDDPLVVSGTVAVDGDVVIVGVVKGSGQIIARGNVYAVGDVVYADGTDGNGNRTFGRADDGTQNALALTAGGNIMVGDYLTPKGGDILSVSSRDSGDGSTEMSFTMSEITLFNRMEWTKTQQFLPDQNGNLVPNSTYIPGYQPRYYVLGPGDPVYIYNKMDDSGKGTYWDPVSESWQGKEHISKYEAAYLTEFGPGDPEYANASVINLAPQGNWLSESQLKQFWIEVENARTAGEPFKLDGLYYTNNALFTLSRSDKYGSKTEGKMLVNGSLVASDIGVLVPGSKNDVNRIGLQMNYDNRLREWVNVQDYSTVEFYELGWKQM